MFNNNPMMTFRKIFCYLILIIAALYCSTKNAVAEQINDEKIDWWQKTIIYQIYPRSFMDSNGDGIGDINGITSKLKYLALTGIGAIWLSPIFKSPMVDFGYDISDFKAIQPEYGTMEDFARMLAEAKRFNIKVILDLVPNHSSDQHEWFKKSIANEKPYDTYYVWHDGIMNPDGGRPFVPNNWVSVFYGSAWEWNEERQQYYLHQFTKEQPDLNFRDANVVAEFQEILLFWLDKGVDGFRIDAINHMFEDSKFLDEPLSGETTDIGLYSYLNHIYTKDQTETYDMIYKWRKLLDDYQIKNGGDSRVMLTEAYTNIKNTMKYYGTDDGLAKGSHMPFNFLMITDLKKDSNARDFLFTLNTWMSFMPLGQTPNWVLGNHDNSRVGTRFGKERIDALNMLLLMLPGVAVTYNGEEIGMIDHGGITWDQTKDPAALNTNKMLFKEYTRDPERTPYQWNTTKNAGFSTVDVTWLPVHPDYETLNLEIQQTDPRSHYNIYRQLAALRKTHTLIHGEFKPLAIKSDVLAFLRYLRNHTAYVVVINLGAKQQVVNLSAFKELDEPLFVEVVSSGSKLQIGTEMRSEAIDLGPYDSVVLKKATDKTSGKSSLKPIKFVIGTLLIGLFAKRYWNL